MNKSDVVSRLAEATNLSRTQASAVVDAIFHPQNGLIAEALRSGEKVAISGFGSFEARSRAARTGRDPRTGKEVQIAASTSAAFKSGKGLKDTLGK